MQDGMTLEAIAGQVGLTLARDSGGLALSDGTMTVRGDFSRMARRIAPKALSRELLVRAAKVNGVESPTAVDATAGLGDDSLLLAAAGFSVLLFERNPVIAAMLADALARAAAIDDLSNVVARMKLVESDSVSGLAELSFCPDVVLLDPMFPDKRKSSAAKKKLQLLQRLEQPCEDETTLLEAALAAHPHKVVVKRPVKGPYLAGREPDYSIAGKAIRFDCIVR